MANTINTNNWEENLHLFREFANDPLSHEDDRIQLIQPEGEA